MPDSSDNVNSGARASAVDWSRPIEAVHEDGRVVSVKFSRERRDWPGDRQPYEIVSELDDGAQWFRGDGEHPYSSWRIRNVQPTTPKLDPALWDRMVALVRDMAATPNHLKGSWSREAAAIVADLPKPVDPDLIEARTICSKEASRRGDSGLAMEYLAGDLDDQMEMTATVAALRRGRELAAPEVSHVG